MCVAKLHLPHANNVVLKQAFGTIRLRTPVIANNQEFQLCQARQLTYCCHCTLSKRSGHKVPTNRITVLILDVCCTSMEVDPMPELFGHTGGRNLS